MPNNESNLLDWMKAEAKRLYKSQQENWDLSQIEKDFSKRRTIIEASEREWRESKALDQVLEIIKERYSK